MATHWSALLASLPLPRAVVDPACADDEPGGPEREGTLIDGETGAMPGSNRRYHVISRGAAPPHDEAELARRLAAGDVDALTAVSEWLWESLAAYAYRIVDDRDTAADIAQEACVRLWNGRTSSPAKSIRPFLFRITRNLALDHIKTRRTRRRLLRLHESARPRVAAPRDLDRDRVSRSVQSAIQDLPERRREVFSLAYLRGLSYAEVGEVMGISPKTVHNQMTAALAQLREVLRPLIEERRGNQTEGEGEASDAG